MSLKRLSAMLLLAVLLAACAPATTLVPASPAAPVGPTAAPTAGPTTVPPPTAEPTRTPTVDEVRAGFDAFLNESYYQLLRRDPETVTELGLADALGVDSAQLTDISEAYIGETQALERAILEQLRQYDRAALTPEQQLSADVYAWYLEDRVRGQPFVDSDYPVNPTVLGVQYDLQLWFTDLFRLQSQADAEAYIACLSQVGVKLDQLIAGLQRRRAAGAVLPSFLIPWTLEDLRAIARGPAASTPYYTAFAGKVEALAGLSDAEKQDLLTAAEQEIAGTVMPAYQALVDALEGLQRVAPDEPGLWQVPNGAAYYAYLLRHYTTTDLTADEIHALGLRELERIHAEMRAIFDELGYPQDEDLPDLYDRVRQDGGTLYGDQILEGYEALIAEAEERMAEVFDLRPRAAVVVLPDPAGGYYVPPALDGSRPGAFYAAVSGTQARYAMPSLAYHEAVPGHHYQVALAQELDLPAFRRNADFTGYVEGWALYAERLAWELGFYEGDPYGNLGRLQMEALRAARLVVDTGVNAKGWTFNEGVDFMVENTGRPSGGMQYEVTRYSVMPGQATAYAVGYVRILELRRQAQEALGERFDFKEFHNLILGSGAVPLAVLERIVDEYVAARSAPAPAAAGDGVVEGWALLADKDNYDDVEMTNLPTGYIALTQTRQLLAGQGWPAANIRELREFDRASLEEGLAWLAQEADADDLVLVYVAAHGKYLKDVLRWADFFPAAWQAIPSRRQVLLIDSCQAANYTRAILPDPEPFVAIAAVAGDEYGWSGLPEEGLPIIGGVFTHYFVAAFAGAAADGDGNGRVSVQEAAGWAEAQQRTYMHDVVFAVREFRDLYDPAVVADPAFPDVVVDDTLGEPLYLEVQGEAAAP